MERLDAAGRLFTPRARAEDATTKDSLGSPRLQERRARPILWGMSSEPERFDPNDRAREKLRSREEDARALASGEKSLGQLRRENGHFAFPNVRVSLRGSKPLE